MRLAKRDATQTGSTDGRRQNTTARSSGGLASFVIVVWIAVSGLTADAQAPPPGDDASVQYEHAARLLDGADLEGGHARARKLFQQAAEQGLVVAQYALGRMFREGLGGNVDDRAALRWLQSAADGGHARAQYFIGLMHGQGRGVSRSYVQAVFWYTRAATGNVPEAQYLLCLSYALGRGIASDVVKAYAWCEVAARAQLPGAIDARRVLADSMSVFQVAQAAEVAAILRRGYVVDRLASPEQ